METTTYNSNSNNAFLKETGPYRINSADNSLKGQTVYEYQIQYQQNIYGKQTICTGSKSKTKSGFLKLR